MPPSPSGPPALDEKGLQALVSGNRVSSSSEHTGLVLCSLACGRVLVKVPLSPWWLERQGGRAEALEWEQTQGLCRGPRPARVEGRWWQAGDTCAGPHATWQSWQVQPLLLVVWQTALMLKGSSHLGLCPGADKGDIGVTYEAGSDFAAFSGGCFWLSPPGLSCVLGAQLVRKDGLAALPARDCPPSGKGTGQSKLVASPTGLLPRRDVSTSPSPAPPAPHGTLVLCHVPLPRISGCAGKQPV